MSLSDDILRCSLKIVFGNSTKLTKAQHGSIKAVCLALAYEAVTADGKKHKDTQLLSFAGEVKAAAARVHTYFRVEGFDLPSFVPGAANYTDLGRTKPWEPSGDSKTQWDAASEDRRLMRNGFLPCVNTALKSSGSTLSKGGDLKIPSGTQRVEFVHLLNRLTQTVTNARKNSKCRYISPPPPLPPIPSPPPPQSVYPTYVTHTLPFVCAEKDEDSLGGSASKSAQREEQEVTVVTASPDENEQAGTEV